MALETAPRQHGSEKSRLSSYPAGNGTTSYVTGPGSQIVYGVDFDASGTVYSTGFATGNIYPAGYQSYTAAPGIAETFLYGFKP